MMSSQAQVDPVLVREALQKLLHSTFVPAGSVLATMLAHVVERTLEGDSRSIKAYTIAVEAFGRSPDFDPDRDSTVRVTAMRLRAALDLYYAGPGADDPVRIRMVPGSYRPIFEAAAQDEAVPSPATDVRPAPEAPARRSRAPVFAAWLAALTIVLALDVAMTVSLLANQVRSDTPAVSEAIKPVSKGILTAEKVSPQNPVLELIQRDVQRSFHQSVE